MTIRKLRSMPPSGQLREGSPVNPTPPCESTVQIVNGHDEEWRKKRYGEEWKPCTRTSTVILDHVHLCRRHAGERVLEQYLRGELIKKKTPD
jgi:hypothetical protein